MIVRFVLALTLLLTACSGDSSSGDDSCVPGETTICVCAPGRYGVQSCKDDGTWSACDCSTGPSGGSGGAGGSGGLPGVGGSGGTGGADGCTADDDCADGTLCEPATGACVEGCRDTGDCDAGMLCIAADRAIACADRQRESCPIGTCARLPCGEGPGCVLGERCVDGACTQDESALCSNCTSTPGEPSGCGTDEAAFCLVDSADPTGMSTFCGSDCAAGQGCPWGYECRDVLVATAATCRSDAQCAPAPGAPSCERDADCPAGGRCDAGRCAGRCAIGEEAPSGFCSCLTDGDCPQQRCDGGRCELSREACGTDDDCRERIRCVATGGMGMCRIGSNCAPGDGLSCADLRP